MGELRDLFSAERMVSFALIVFIAFSMLFLAVITTRALNTLDVAMRKLQKECPALVYQAPIDVHIYPEPTR